MWKNVLCNGTARCCATSREKISFVAHWARPKLLDGNFLNVLRQITALIMLSFRYLTPGKNKTMLIDILEFCLSSKDFVGHLPNLPQWPQGAHMRKNVIHHAWATFTYICEFNFKACTHNTQRVIGINFKFKLSILSHRVRCRQCRT